MELCIRQMCTWQMWLNDWMQWLQTGLPSGLVMQPVPILALAVVFFINLGLVSLVSAARCPCDYLDISVCIADAVCQLLSCHTYGEGRMWPT